MKLLAGAKALLADFLDRGARPCTSDTKADTIKAAVGAAAAIASGMSDVAKLAFSPSAAPFFVVISPIVFLASVLFIVASKDDQPAPLLDARGMPGNGAARYRYPRLLRSAAKLLAPVLALQVLFNAYELLPNGVTGRTVLAGTICGEGGGIAAARVSVVDKYGNLVSKREEISDDRGFVVLDLRATAFAPAQIRIRGLACGGSRDISIGEPAVGTCGAAAVSSASAYLWRVSCNG